MDRARNSESGMKCKSGRYYSPVACEGFGHCRELNMAKTFHDGKITLHAGDCLDVLKAVPENSIDAVVTDPPYHLTANKKGGSGVASVNLDSPYGRSRIGTGNGAGGFMGQAWDGGDIAFRPELWAEVLRVLKPGGHMVAMGGSRTFHRLACAIEDAGFEIRDQLAWVYGSGFPKSHNVALGIDKSAGAIGARGSAINFAGKGERADIDTSVSASNGKLQPGYNDPITDAARQWQGYGTALKPSWEPICLVRKPLSESTVAANVLRWGTGALNIDGCRIGIAEQERSVIDARSGAGFGTIQCEHAGREKGEKFKSHSAGRWPANLCHDGSPEVLAGFPETTSGNLQTHHRLAESENGSMSGKNYARSPRRTWAATPAAPPVSSIRPRRMATIVWAHAIQLSSLSISCNGSSG
jgi:hypothetical protein